jgi:long-subunit fatty acid transport protein
MRRLSIGLVTLIVGAWAPRAMAGGYDTPMLYSARHMGMGGTAVGYVSDPSALFHNPAGLAHTERLTLMGDFSLLVGTIHGSPDTDPGSNRESDTTIAPFFLVGGAVRILDWLSAGLAVYPVASAGADYRYGPSDHRTLNKTKLVFIEFSPGFAVNLPQHINLGFGYRANIVTLDRTERAGDDPATLDFSLSGANFFSFRAGAQWQPMPELQLGLSYRHKTVTDVSADRGTAFTVEGTDLKSSFTLPSRLSFGVRGDVGDFGGALDVEYGFNSQNHKSALSGTFPLGPLSVDNIFDWSDSVTLRAGVEYRFLRGALATRLGYVFDSRVSNKHYPTAFGTPPAPTNVLTAGAGYDAGPWQVNLAYAYRFGSTTVTAADIDAADPACTLCGKPGDYAIHLHGLYIDFTYRLGTGSRVATH